MTHKILVVADDASLQDQARTVLENAGYDTLFCGTAEEARAAFGSQRPDLVVIDIGLPGGRDLLSELGLGPGGEVPFMLLTAQLDLASRLESTGYHPGHPFLSSGHSIGSGNRSGSGGYCSQRRPAWSETYST